MLNEYELFKTLNKLKGELKISIDTPFYSGQDRYNEILIVRIAMLEYVLEIKEYYTY